MEDFKVPNKPPQRPLRPVQPPEATPGRSEGKLAETSTASDPRPKSRDTDRQKPTGGRFKRLLGIGEKSRDGRSAEPPDERTQAVPRRSLDGATVLEALAVPAALHGKTGCYALVAESLASAFNAVADLTDETPWGGRNADGSTTRPPPTPRYSPTNFTPSALSYQRLPLVPRNEWLPFLHALLFADERQARDLNRQGFDKTLAAIWKAGDGRAKPSQGSAASSSSPLDELIDRMWKQIYQSPDRWRGKSLPEIARAIYVHCYLGLEQDAPSGKQKASEADVGYWTSLPRAMEVGDRKLGDEFDPGEFYYLGEKVEASYRIYIHARYAVAGAVLRDAETVMKEQRHAWCAKIASPVEAKFRPDTIVIYVADEDPDRVQKLAETLHKKIDQRNRIDSVPPLTTEVGHGISTAWDPECVDKDHSFGSFNAGILAEAFYDVVANMATPTEKALADTARLFLAPHGVKPSRPGDRPVKLGNNAPANMAKFAGADDSSQAALSALAQSPPEASPIKTPVQTTTQASRAPSDPSAPSSRIRVRVLPATDQNELASARKNLKPSKPPRPGPPPRPGKPHDT